MKIYLREDSYANGRYLDEEGHVWNVTRLTELSKDLPVFEISVAGIYIGSKIWSIRSARELAEHVKRVGDTSLDYPVILDPDGFIVDGWHRVVKALVEGRETISAVRFEVMPSWEYTETN